MQELTEKPPVNIERIDYHFDQLKIERLEGTLNIGLNPSDLQNMDEFRIPTPFPNLQMVQNREFSNQLEQKILDFIENDLPNMIDDKKKNCNLT